MTESRSAIALRTILKLRAVIAMIESLQDNVTDVSLATESMFDDDMDGNISSAERTLLVHEDLTRSALSDAKEHLRAMVEIMESFN